MNAPAQPSSGRRRTVTARILTVIGALLLIAGSIAGWADRTLFDANALAARARSSLDSPAVRTVIARTLVRSVVERARPDLLAARPLLESAAETVVATDAFASVFETAARTGARLLVEKPDQNVVLRANEAVLLLVDTVREYAPNVAAQIPGSVDAVLASVADVSSERELWRDAARAQELGWLLPLLGVLAWVGALVAAPDRRRAVMGIGVAAVAGGAILLVGLEVGGRVVAAQPDTAIGSDAARAVWDTFTEGLATVAWFGVAIGLLAAAAAIAARPDHSRLTIHGLGDRARAALAYEPTRPRNIVVWAVVAAATGLVMIFEPRAVLELLVVAVGLALVFVALTSVLELLARPDAADVERPVRRRPVVAIAVVAALVIAGITTVVLIVTSPENQRASSAIVTCNEHQVLCTRRLDHVAFATSHNASSAADDGYLNANHVDGISAQLRRGIHGFQLDAFLGTRRGGRVYTDLTNVQIEKFTDEVGPDLVERALSARAIVGPPPESARQELYLCHVFCELGATKASDAFDEMARFLRSHPNNVLVWIIEDYAPVDVIDRALARAGLDDQRYPIDPDEPLPTLRRMIVTGRRLVVTLENQDGGPLMPNAYENGIVQETPFTFATPAALAARSSCAEERGTTSAPLFLLNHWITPASISATRDVNAFGFLDDRALGCQRLRGLLPNLVAVDFTSVGDVFGVVDSLNGIRPASSVGNR